VVRAYQDTCAKVIARFDAYCRISAMAAGLLGYPQAHEDDARAPCGRGSDGGALGQLIRAWPRSGVYNWQCAWVHTGSWWGEVGGGAHAPGGKLAWRDPNVAAACKGLAAPNTLVGQCGNLAVGWAASLLPGVIPSC